MLGPAGTVNVIVYLYNHLIHSNEDKVSEDTPDSCYIRNDKLGKKAVSLGFISDPRK